MINFKKLYSGFVKIVVIFLILIAVNSLVAMFMPSDEKAETDKEVQAPTENIEVSPSPVSDVDIDATDSAQDEIPSSVVVEEISPIAYESQSDDQNAFELLKDAAEIEYKEYDFGVFVESINGIKGDDKHFWAFYVNDEQAQAGADQIILQQGDKVEWRYEEIQ